MVKKVGDIELYTVKELAKLLDFQETTVRKMLREGTLKGKKLGKKWFITDKAIQDYFMEEEKNKDDEGKWY
jgi:excisionase family DNA binding protein